jgi:hypothetical protein
MLTKHEADQWFTEHSLPDIKIFPNKDIEQHLRYALSQVSTQDLFLEFGVRDRKTFNVIKEYSNVVHGFDSWTGMPWPWQLTRLVEPAKTGPHLAAKSNEPISFLHIDSNYYRSATQVLTALNDYITNDTVIVIGQCHAFEQADLKKWSNIWNHGLLACKNWGRNIKFFSRNHFLQVAGKII